MTTRWLFRLYLLADALALLLAFAVSMILPRRTGP